MINKIEVFLDKEIKPYLLQHNGDIEILSFQKGVLEVKLLGQCSGCAGANDTIENFVEAKTTRAIPEVKEVILNNDVNEELYELARKILNKNID